MRHLVRRVLFYAFAVWVAIMQDFFILRLAPGDPVAGIVGNMKKAMKNLIAKTKEAVA